VDGKEMIIILPQVQLELELELELGKKWPPSFMPVAKGGARTPLGPKNTFSRRSESKKFRPKKEIQFNA
jgi:hypothetical protein